MRGLRVLVQSALVGLLLTGAKELPKQPLRVCDVFEHLNRYDGKMIAVRGVYNQEIHRSALSGGSCPAASRYGFPGQDPSFWLVMPEAAEAVGARPVQFQMDPKGLAEYERIPRPEASERVRVEITVVGQLTVFKEFKLNHWPNGTYTGNAFGPGGRYPAVLVMQTVKDLETTKSGDRRPDARREKGDREKGRDAITGARLPTRGAEAQREDNAAELQPPRQPQRLVRRRKPALARCEFLRLARGESALVPTNHANKDVVRRSYSVTADSARGF